jgi:protein phosphatase
LAVGVIGDFIAQNFGRIEPESLLHEAFSRAGQAIDDQAAHNPNAHGMGCTCVAVLGIRERLWVAHAGDSRAYRVRADTAEQITTDHTMVQELVEQGLLTPAQAANHPYRGRISRCLGHGKQKSDADVRAVELDKGDNILICSDGLSDVVTIDELVALVGQRDVRDASRRLIEAANKAGGPDNISAIVMRRVV